ncbi:hypothetical protein Tco_1124298 [Tanacetum coccineum]|uniref:Uncharacterized protein n=1 Tax=Tanacetum coccineum TaxID=301880 RepID=A0ABQ5J5T3_9ASTR
MATHVNGVLASGVVMIFEMDIAFYVVSLACDTITEIEHAFEDKQYQPEGILELFHKLLDDVQNTHKELAEYINALSWNPPTIYCDDDDDDDEDYTIAITPDLPITDSLIMEDEHLDTILATESDELINSSVENLVQIISESEGIPDNMCDLPFRDNSLPLDTLKDQLEGFSDSNDDSTSIDDDSFSIDDINYVDASPPDSELDDVLSEKLLKINLLIAKIEALNADPTPSFDFVLKSPIPVKDKNSGSTTIHVDISLPDLECFYLKSEPDPGDLTSIDPGIRENVSSTTNDCPDCEDSCSWFCLSFTRASNPQLQFGNPIS